MACNADLKWTDACCLVQLNECTEYLLVFTVSCDPFASPPLLTLCHLLSQRTKRQKWNNDNNFGRCFQKSSEYNQQYQWLDSVKSASFVPTHSQAQEPAGLSSQKLGMMAVLYQYTVCWMIVTQVFRCHTLFLLWRSVLRQISNRPNCFHGCKLILP